MRHEETQALVERAGWISSENGERDRKLCRVGVRKKVPDYLRLAQ